VIAHFQFDPEGRIQQETAYYDALTFMRQWGSPRAREGPTKAAPWEEYR